MIFSTITQDGLKLTTDINTIPAQLSNNIQIKFVQDETNYSGWIPTVQAGLLDSEIVECADTIQTSALVIEDGIITVSNNIMSKSGYLVLSITLTNDDENVVLPPVAYKVDASVGAVSILPDDTEAWQQVIDTYTSVLFSAYSEENVAPVLSQAQQAVQTANSASQTATNTSNTINQAIQDGDFIPQISATATQGAEGSQPSVTVTGNKETPTINFTIPKGDTGEQGPPGEQGIQGEQGPAGPSSVMVNGVIQNSIDLKGVGFYISDDDESVTIGTYEEWVAAGSPAFPSE